MSIALFPPKGINPKYSKGLILKLNRQNSGLLMLRTDSREKSLMLGKIEGQRRSGWQKMRWLDSITNSMDVNLSRIWETVKDRGAWHTEIHGVTKSQTWLRHWTTTRLISETPFRMPERSVYMGCILVRLTWSCLYRKEWSIIPKNGGGRSLKWVYIISKLFILIIIQEVIESVLSHYGYSHIQRQTSFLRYVNKKELRWQSEKVLLSWPKSSFRLFCNILWKIPNKLFGQSINFGRDVSNMQTYQISLNGKKHGRSTEYLENHLLLSGFCDKSLPVSDFRWSRNWKWHVLFSRAEVV